jgi:hypothetical protein
MEFQKWLITKQNLGKNCSLKTGLYSYVWTLKKLLSELENFFADLHICRTSCDEHFPFWKCGLNRLKLILKKFRLSLMVHKALEFKNSNFQIDLK